MITNVLPPFYGSQRICLYVLWWWNGCILCFSFILRCWVHSLVRSSSNDGVSASTMWYVWCTINFCQPMNGIADNCLNAMSYVWYVSALYQTNSLHITKL